MVKVMAKHTSSAVCAAAHTAVLLVCIKAIFNTPVQDLQHWMRQQQASQGTASAGQTPHLAMHLMPQVGTVCIDEAYCSPSQRTC